jgi:hypothetical protein
MSNQAIRNQRVMAKCQEAYDNMEPPVEYCRECGREATCDCICSGEVIDIEEEDEGYSGILGEG